MRVGLDSRPSCASLAPTLCAPPALPLCAPLTHPTTLYPV
uniref:Uncharacterized protein n=1 Tax=viral metagenome TaxID=1070528 RepID=A0A6C0D8V0_9ZZZZ